MSEQRIKIPRLSDRAIADAFKELGGRYGVNTATIQALGFANLGSVNLHEGENADWKQLLSHDSYLIDIVALNLPALSINYFRGGNYAAADKSPVFDEILIRQNNTSSTNKDKLAAIAFINERLRPFEPGRIIPGAPSPESNQLLAIHQNTLERLERLNEDLIRQSANFREKLEEQYDEKVESLQKKIGEEQAQVEQELLIRIRDLDAREQSLEAKLKTIDDRDNTHARREIRNKMLDDVRARINQFGVSKTTEDKRVPVKLGIYSLCIVLLGLLYWTGFEIYSIDKQYFSQLESVRNISLLGVEKLKAEGVGVELAAKLTAPDVDRSYLYWLWIRLSLFSLGLLGTIVYYIKWQNKWAEQHANAEFQLQQFYIDVNRANWVLESCLEWRKETDSVIPKTLISSITKGLFSNAQPELERVAHPADELASALMGSASKLKLKLGENEMEFDKPKKIRNIPLRKQEAEDSK